MALAAVAYVPAGVDYEPWGGICARYASSRGYEMRHVARDWADVMALIDDEAVQIVVVGTRSHLPPDRVPRVEIVDEWQEPRGSRRPRRL